jgi:hypothetical protein
MCTAQLDAHGYVSAYAATIILERFVQIVPQCVCVRTQQRFRDFIVQINFL